jgi:hypothetical protein
MILPLLATIIIGTTTPPYPIFTEDIITTTWESMGEDIEYTLQCAPTEDFSSTFPLHTPTTNTQMRCQFLKDTLNCRRLWYREIGSNLYNYIDLGCYYVDLPEPLTPPVITPPDIAVQEEKKRSLETLPSLNIQKTEPEITIDIPEALPSIEREVLGIEDSNLCNFNFLKKKSIKFESTDCDLGVKIDKNRYIKNDKVYTLEIDGSYLNTLNANINLYICKQFNLLDPNTWFRCEKELESSTVGNILLEYISYFNISNRDIYPDSFLFKSSSFFIKKILGKDITNEKISIKIKAYGEVKFLDEYIFFEKLLEIPIEISPEDISKSNKPFSFPLDRYIGVTQWHGCTDYQCPHKGIDFGARLNSVLSVGDGIVTEVGFDKYGGECNQGGRYIKVKHTNGMYTTYFHLDSTKVVVNQNVKKGELIGISGNSGKWNCQNLGYHLHFETRKDSSSSSHTNPTDYIDIDWDLIPTLGIANNPGRLSGDNPHPNF